MGANLCIRTKYVDVNAILGNQDTSGAMTVHFREVYTSAPEVRKESNETQEAHVLQYPDPGYEGEKESSAAKRNIQGMPEHKIVCNHL